MYNVHCTSIVTIKKCISRISVRHLVNLEDPFTLLWLVRLVYMGSNTENKISLCKENRIGSLSYIIKLSDVLHFLSIFELKIENH